jgi:hypothetical protein
VRYYVMATDVREAVSLAIAATEFETEVHGWALEIGPIEETNCCRIHAYA